MMARLHCARRECYALDRVSPTLRPGRVTLARPALFSKSHQRSSPPLIRPTDVGYLRLILLSNGTRRWAFGLRHPWLRPKPASNIHVLAPNRVELCSPFPDFAHGPAPLARHPASRPGQEGSPQRIRGGSIPCQPTAPSNSRYTPSPLGRGLE